MTRNAVPLVLFLAFVGVPILEIALFIQIGGLIGLWYTIGIVILTAVLGTALVRAQGIRVITDFQHRMNDGRDPTGPIAHGLMILVAGLLLLTPGFFTDAVGFALLMPPVRAAIIAAVRPMIIRHIVVRRGSDEGVIDGEYEAVDLPPDDGPRGASGWTRPR